MLFLVSSGNITSFHCLSNNVMINHKITSSNLISLQLQLNINSIYLPIYLSTYQSINQSLITWQLIIKNTSRKISAPVITIHKLNLSMCLSVCLVLPDNVMIKNTSRKMSAPVITKHKLVKNKTNKIIFMDLIKSFLVVELFDSHFSSLMVKFNYL